MNHIRNSIKSKIKLIIVGVIGFFIAVGMLGYFYQNSQKSRADAIAIDFKFSQTSLTFTPEEPTQKLDINIFGTKKISGATVLVSYPKDILKLESIEKPEICNSLRETFKAVVDEPTGTIAITKILPSGNDADLPPAAGQPYFCFAQLIFSGVSSTSTEARTGKIVFIDGPVSTSQWEVVGPEGEYAPNYTGQEVAVTVTGQNFPTVTPSPTSNPNITNTPTPSPTIVATLTPTPTSNPNITNTPTPSPTIVATLTPIPTGFIDAKVNYRIKFQGITGKPKNANSVDVKLGIYRADGEQIDSRTVTFTPQTDGAWVADTEYKNIPNTDYFVTIKGPKHLQKKICEINPIETVSGTYRCKDEKINLKAGNNTLDFTDIYMLAGDLPLQNGIVDAVDIIYIRSNFGSQIAEVTARGDLNYDGIVDSQDYGIIISALSFKYDEVE